MTTYSVTRDIDAPPQAVWDLLTDASTYGSWNDAIVSLEGPIAVGNRLALVSIVNPDRTFKPKVVEMTEPSRMVWADGMPLGLFKGVRTYTLTPQGSGTRFTMEEVFSGLMEPMISKSIPDMSDSFEQFADGLKRAAESTR